MTALNTASRTLAKSNLLPISGFRDPLSIPGLAAWWDFSNAAYLSTATNGIGAVSNGSQIAYCADRSGNGFHLTQATLSSRPTWNSTGLNSLGAASFDGTNDVMSTTTNFTPITGAGSLSLLAVFTRNNANSGAICSSVAAVINRSSFIFGEYFNVNAGTLAAYSGGTLLVRLSASQTTSTGIVIAASFETQPQWHYSFMRNGTLIAPLTLATAYAGNVASLLNVGFLSDSTSGSPGNLYHNGLIAELLVYSRTLSQSNLLTISRYLGAKWGVTVA